MSKSNAIFLAIISILLLIILLRGKPTPERIVEQSIDTVQVIFTKTDTVEIVREKKIYIKEYVPIIQDSIAILDTVFTALDDDTLKIEVEMHTEYNLRSNLFQNLSLGFPLIQYAIDTVYVEMQLTKQITVQQKPSLLSKISYGVVGAGLAISIYAIVQGI